MLKAADPPESVGIARFPPPPEWHLTLNGEEYLRGGFYVCERKEEETISLRESVLYIGKHPDLKPVHAPDPLFADRQCLQLPEKLRGLLVTELGIPYYQQTSGRPRDCSLVAVTHTPESILEQFPNEIGLQGAEHMKRIQDLMFTLGPGEKGLWWRTASFKDNDRSAGQGSGEGSFSCAGTIQKGEGQGVFVPAIQNASPRVQEVLRDLFSHFGKLHRIMRLTSQRADHYMMGEAEQEINNSPRIGDGESGGTSVQLNIHYSERPFSETIGFEQAEPHTDDEDDPCHPTMTIHLTTTPYGMLLILTPIILLTSVSAGSYRGHMWLGEFGLVIPFVAPVQVSLFNATSIHTPQQPAFLNPEDNPPISMDDIPPHLATPPGAESNGHIRLCFIIYTNTKALRRTSAFNFGLNPNRGDMAHSIGPHREQFAKLSDPDRSIWSTPSAQWNYLVMEQVQLQHNGFVSLGTNPPDPNLTLAMLCHPGDGTPARLLAEDLNPVISSSSYRKYIGMIMYQRKVNEGLSLGIRRHELACSQASVKTFGANCTSLGQNTTTLRYSFINQDSRGPSGEVETILGVRQHAKDEQVRPLPSLVSTSTDGAHCKVLLTVKMRGREGTREYACGAW